MMSAHEAHAKINGAKDPADLRSELLARQAAHAARPCRLSERVLTIGAAVLLWLVAATAGPAAGWCQPPCARALTGSGGSHIRRARQ